MNYWESGVFTLYYSGFGIDALNGTTNIALTAIIKDVEVSKELKHVWQLNWEAARHLNETQSSDGNALLEFIDWKDPALEACLRNNQLQSGSAFTIEKSINILRKIENGEDSENDKI